MTHRIAAWFPLLLIAALAALTYWLDRAVQPPVPPRDGSGRHDPDYIVENFVSVRMGPAGTPVHELAASRMMHYPDDDTTHLESPRFVRFDPPRPQLAITAKRALVSPKGEHVYFHGDVRAVRAGSAARSEMTLTTEYLEVIPDLEVARTDRPVVIVDANTKVTAVGLELNSKTQTVNLLANVRGTYVRPK
jgi:lipopolysaccharide export system protein LptC